jgi:hypothetical protein
VRPPDISAYRHYIEAALEYGDGGFTYEDIVQAVQDGSFQFWPGVDSMILTEIVNYPRLRAVNVVAAGGNLAEIEAMVPKLEAWARAHGCTEAVFTGRRGWERTFLARTGWAKSDAVIYRRPL